MSPPVGAGAATTVQESAVRSNSPPPSVNVRVFCPHVEKLMVVAIVALSMSDAVCAVCDRAHTSHANRPSAYRVPVRLHFIIIYRIFFDLQGWAWGSNRCRLSVSAEVRHCVPDLFEATILPRALGAHEQQTPVTPPLSLAQRLCHHPYIKRAYDVSEFEHGVLTISPKDAPCRLAPQEGSPLPAVP